MNAADAEEGDWSVGAENEEENITMINDAEDFLPVRRRERA